MINNFIINDSPPCSPATTAPSIIFAPGASGFGTDFRLQQNLSPASGGLRDTDDVQDEKQWHSEGGNVAHGKDGHGPSGDSMRINHPGKRAQG